MAEDGGFCEMKILLQTFRQSEGDETLVILRTLAEHLRKDMEMKEHFHKLNGIAVLLNIAMDANFSVLNSVFDTLAAAAEDHEENRMKLTLERTFILINKVLISTDSLGLTASLRPLVLLSYVCAENVHAQELANLSGCVNEMEKLFLRFSQEMLDLEDVKEEKLMFTWNILCTAIAAVCGEPANKNNQECLQSVVREGANFLSEWIDKSRIKFKDTSCVKNLLIMLPYVLCSNRANQDYFARSGGVHTIVNGLVNLENQKTLDCDLIEIRVKLIYLLSVSLIENSQISKLAGFLGVIPVLVRLMKQFNKKDKGMVLLCLVNLLSCPENEQIFRRLDIFASLTSEIKVFEEGSECWKLLEKISSHVKDKQKNHSDLDLSGSSNSSLHEEKSRRSFSRYMQNGEKQMNDRTLNEEFNFESEKMFNKKSARAFYHQKSHHKFLDDDDYYYEQNRYRNQNNSSQILPSYYKRPYSIRNDDSLVDGKCTVWQYDRKKHYEHGEVNYSRFEDGQNSVLNRFHKSYDKARHSNSPNEYGKRETYSNYEDRYFPKQENTENRQFLLSKDSSSDLINRARRLYPRNKMTELEEIDTHQRRHYLTKRENFDNHDEIGREQLRTLGPRSIRDSFEPNKVFRESYGRESMKGSPIGDFRKDNMRKDWQRTTTERYVRDYYDTDAEEQKEPVIESVGRRSRIDYYRIDKPRKDYPKGPTGRYVGDDLEEEQNRDHAKKLIGRLARDDYNTDESRKSYPRKSLEKYTREDDFQDNERRKEGTRMSRGRGRAIDSDGELREHGKTFMDRHIKDDYRISSNCWKYDPERSRNSRQLQTHKRSKSVGRLNDLEIQSMFKDMELTRHSPSGNSFSQNSEDKKIFDGAVGKRAESPTMPRLVSIRDAYHKYASPEQSPRKSCLRTPSEPDSNTQSVVGFKDEGESNIETKCNDHHPESVEFNDGISLPKEKANVSLEARREVELPDLPEVPAFSEEEEKHLVQGIEKFGLDFKTIYQEFTFHEKRTPHDLYEKWKYSYNF